MIAHRVNQPAVDLWLYSHSIFGGAAHKSQAELLTVNWACQDAQLIQRLCQAIVILCIQTGGPDSPYTTVNGCICQWGFVALAAMEALSIIYWMRWVIGFVSSRFLQRGCFHADFFFFFFYDFLAELSVQFEHTVDANKPNDKVKRGTACPSKCWSIYVISCHLVWGMPLPCELKLCCVNSNVFPEMHESIKYEVFHLGTKGPFKNY